MGNVLFDVVVVGGGFIGFSVVLKFVEVGLLVCVLEVEYVGYGVLGCNGGFCCLGGSKLDSC